MKDFRLIGNTYVPENTIINSKRGEYVVWDKYSYNYFKLQDAINYIDSFQDIERLKQLVELEYNLFYFNNFNELCNHPFWKKEDKLLLIAYMNLYSDFHKAIIENKAGSKNIFSCNKHTCISSLQIVTNGLNEKVLKVYQRSCDLSLGYLADLCTLILFAKNYNCDYIDWTIGCPHVYINNYEKTKIQFDQKRKLIMNFNVRG